MIRLNEPAPDFAASSTHGPLQLSDFRGRWLLLFSHPADFTPVCTSEFVAFARRHAEFESLGCALVGLSVDSLYSHIAWTRSIEQVFGVTIPFPIIDDLSMQISSLYGMIQPAESHTSAIRAAFFIDPEGLLRALVYYPPSAGRSIEELLRLVQALQAGDREDAATPEGWQPGDSLVLPAPKTTQAAQERVLTAKNQGLECLDWYYCRKTAAGPTKKAAA